MSKLIQDIFKLIEETSIWRDPKFRETRKKMYNLHRDFKTDQLSNLPIDNNQLEMLKDISPKLHEKAIRQNNKTIKRAEKDYKNSMHQSFREFKDMDKIFGK
jgi:hypothetical protein